MDPAHRSEDWTGTGPSPKERRVWMKRLAPFGYYTTSRLLGFGLAVIVILIMWIFHA
jgi:hypothetical protein